MSYRSYIPAPPLSDFVETLWYCENDEAPHVKEKVLPSGSAGLFINLRADWLRVYDRHNLDIVRTFSGCLVSGAHSEFTVIDTGNLPCIIGVQFKHGGAFPFLKMPANELHNTQAPLDAVWGAARAGELRERLLEAETADARLRVLEKCLLAVVECLPERRRAVTFALREFQNVPQPRTVSDVTEQIGLSPRRFIQMFSAEVGLTPKLFCRIRRFQEVLGRLSAGMEGGEVDWVSLALRCGYFDQAHFNHDFRAFSGLNPTSYLLRRGEYPNHVPLVD